MLCLQMLQITPDDGLWSEEHVKEGEGHPPDSNCFSSPVSRSSLMSSHAASHRYLHESKIDIKALNQKLIS